ncbi:hypothetical protein PVAP13_7NG107345 [Panicum virgatum]|uniref:Uncharacterized protein n=1 Tax=Panicum virgatum TaxID=38727 RepID=A0A8T0PW86_PANVG|nr:hypothetical protein PVAP13_7NG107345 [Panicum virgatum]
MDTLPPPAQRDIPADLPDRLKEMTNLLEMPITQLVQSEDHLCVALDGVAERLPSDLGQVLLRVADLNLYREEVTKASARIAARQNETELRKEITKESLALHQQRSTLADDSAQSALDSELPKPRRTKNRIAE